MIYLCIPSHNEERTVGVLLWKIRQVMTGFPRDYQVLVLDDASTDRTAQVLAPYARILPLVLFRHERRRGYAASLEELVREAARRSEYPRRDVVVTLQADFTEEPDDIPELLKRIESGADLVTTHARLRPETPRALRWTRWLLARLARRLGWPESVTDAFSGFRAYRLIGLRKALETAGGGPLLEWSDPWAANASLLKQVLPYVRRVDEVEIMLRDDRRQRPSRFEPKATAAQVLRLAFGRRPAEPIPPRDGGPVAVRPDERPGLGAALPAPAGNGAPRRERNGRNGGRGGGPARGSAPARAVAGGGREEAPARRSGSQRRGAADPAAGNGAARRPRGSKSARPAAADIAAAGAGTPPAEAAPAGAEAAPRPSRPPRRRRKPSSNGAAPAAKAESGAADATAAPLAEDTPAAADVAAGDAAAPAEKPKRPRRRGGRGRSRGRRGGANGGAAGEGGGAADGAPVSEGAGAAATPSSPSEAPGPPGEFS